MRVYFYLSALVFIWCFTCATNTRPVHHMVFTKTASTSTETFGDIEVVDVFDGDTFTVNLPHVLPNVFGKKMPVRIRHIDTAEMRGNGRCEKEMALKAKSITESLLKTAKKIDLENVKRDKYFRLLCSVIIITKNKEKINLSDFLLKTGYAVPYEGETKPKTDWCKMLRNLPL